ncbi:Blue copper -like protein [Gossypium arboreum]|uniref:Blue copper-like protein n=1 Tax=Gossypium arboreum TaxID=29729 RepID=A0A0B0PTF1_GOSAR|nr:Blue copper -like protein [Gossypium arboreum]
MGGKISMAAFFVVLAANVLQSTYGATYKVGGSTGWRVPTNIDFYEDWADDKVFVVGDALVFNFTTGKHNVAVVTEAAYEACNTTDTITIICDGPARITLNRTGNFYFICAVPGHCSGGQKLRVEVRNGNRHAAAPAPGPMPNSKPPSAATPSPTPHGTSSPPRPSATPRGTSSPPPPSATPPGTSSPPPPSAATPGTPSATGRGTSSPPPEANSASLLVATLYPILYLSIALVLLC